MFPADKNICELVRWLRGSFRKTPAVQSKKTDIVCRR